MVKPRILIIEDDRSLAEVLGYNLEQAGYEVLVAYDGQDGLYQAQLKTPELVLLDLMLPVIDGKEVCRRLRARSETQEILIMMLTAKSEETDQVVGFSLGADDYVTKPFSVKVLLERIKALIRRGQGAPTDHEMIVHQGVMIDRRSFRATAGEQLLPLTRSEFRLLDALIRQPGRAFSRAELIDAALGDDAYVMERTIDVHIRALRKKLAEHADVIETVRGIGYRFRETTRETSR
ncbi:response regulator [Lignipirellula cremea]|uniref:Phosphate regulon transcriptional regulatory protein PhoB n=1 Tax=Lignipirellula cremea TaxID=2528010 RepID=A0A518E293_9BACT|nr:response regulator [Lignipirellula cremea]QDU98215.1 Phosphate regulon transcriptional regulatory protein PhoB [Lignipirellula cremea]